GGGSRTPHPGGRRRQQVARQARRETPGARPRPPVSAAGVFLAGAVRTPIGRFGGALASSSAAALGRPSAAATLARSGVPLDAVDEVIAGHARQAGNGPNLARQIVRRAGLADRVPAFTINKACASGMQAIASGAASVRLGESALVLACGV